ncbi:membrane protein [Planctomycetales bacterium]|nr:membrane protein [Planctomycetales bacterium]
MFHVSFYPIFGSSVFVAVVVLTLAAIVLRSSPKSETLPKYGSRLLVAVRFLALLLLAFGLLRPALVYTKSERLSATVYVLLDQSESMTRPDEIGGKTRFQFAKESLENAAPQLRQLQAQCEVKAFTFDSALTPLELQNGTIQNLPEQPTGKETALGLALDTIRERGAGKRILGTLLLSDGSQRTRPQRDVLPEDAAARLRDSAAPLYTVSFGQAGLAGSVRDVSVDAVQGNDRVFVKNKFIVSGSIRISGFIGLQIPVQLYLENEKGEMVLVNTTYIAAKDDGQLIAFRLQCAANQVGTFKYSVRVPPQEKELVETNNEQSGFVRVMDGGLRVLCLQGQHNFEQGQLRRSLAASPDINVQYIRLTDGRRTFLTETLQNEPINVFILDDVDSTFFRKDELQLLADKVKEGAGLIMLGGLHSFGAGGYADTPLNNVCPFELYRTDRQQKDAPIRADIHWSPLNPVPILLTAAGKQHFVLRFEADAVKNEQRWAKLPPLLGANRFSKLKPGATLLAEGMNGEMLLASQLWGLGRVLAFAGDSTYRWHLAGFDEEHRLFWRQIILWLAKMEAGMDGTCWMTLESNHLMPGDTAKFQIFLRTSEGEDLKNFKAKATVLKPDNNTETVELVNEDGTPSGSFRSTDFSGDYTINVEAAIGDDVKQATARFLVQNRNMELDNPVAYPQLLANIAARTGGKTVPPEQLGKLIDELIQQSNDLVEKRETKRTLFDTWTVLLTFILLLSTEWFLRKHWGLV